MSRLVTDLNSLRNWVSLGLARMISSGGVAGTARAWPSSIRQRLW
jgi:hypothetical protein